MASRTLLGNSLRSRSNTLTFSSVNLVALASYDEFSAGRFGLHKSTAGSSKFAIREHTMRSKAHQIDRENVKVLEREPKEFSFRILEAIHIRTWKPKLNRDKELDLDPVWDNLFMRGGGGGGTTL